MDSHNDIKYLIIDVDGTMTDGGIYYDEHGNEIKKFCTKDAVGFFSARMVGIKILVLTGRRCISTGRRMRDLNVDFLEQNIKDKKNYLDLFMQDNQISKENIAYIGDDWNDYAAMSLCRFKACPADAANEIKEICDYVSPYNGGHGAVRDIVEHILKKQGQWEDILKMFKINM